MKATGGLGYTPNEDGSLQINIKMEFNLDSAEALELLQVVMSYPPSSGLNLSMLIASIGPSARLELAKAVNELVKQTKS